MSTVPVRVALEATPNVKRDTTLVICSFSGNLELCC